MSPFDFLTNAVRAKEIATVFARHGFAEVIQQINPPPGFLHRIIPQPRQRRSVWERLRLAAEELGPTFVKSGQLLSMRPDVIPEALVSELRRLQDNVKPLPFAEMRPVLAEELGEELDAIFSEFDETPVASASLAQVYRARLRSNGRLVAVKLQRPHLRDPENEWFGLSVRARTVVYNNARVKPSDLSTYEDLANPKWKGRLCLRTSKKVYNQSLVAMMIYEHGEAKTEDIVRGWVANLATAPFPDDTRAMQAVAAGQCDVTVVNTYYFGRLMEKTPGLPLAIFWPNQNLNNKAAGVHVNISGAGVTRHAKDPAGAQRLLEWLSSAKAQSLFADVNLEYPVNPAVAPDKTVAAWGSFKQNLINVSEAGRLQAQAVRLMDRVGYK